MSKALVLIRFFNRRWYVWLSLLIVTTIVFMVWGHTVQNEQFRLTTALYQAAQAFTLEFADNGAALPWQIEVARWSGLLVCFSAIGAVVVRLFEQLLLTLFIQTAARNHVVIAGLGEPQTHADRLVADLITSGFDVVVLENDRDHPASSRCRDAGAAFLVGSPLELTHLKRCRLERAAYFLCLFGDDHNNVEAAIQAIRVLAKTRQPRRRSSPLRCTIQISDPSAIETVRRHEMCGATSPQLRVDVFNTHEITARAMLRESIPRLNRLFPRKILLLGTGTNGRLGETFVSRYVKDWLIENHQTIDRGGGGIDEKLRIDVFDRDAKTWVEELTERHPYIATAAIIRGRSCAAGKCGFSEEGDFPSLTTGDYDSVFICLANELDAMVQASRIAQHFEGVPPKERPPIVVRVAERDHGCGGLLSGDDAGGLGKRIFPVGIFERVFDVATVLNPSLEMRAQAMHEEYLRKTRLDITAAKQEGNEGAAGELKSKPAVARWSWDRLAPQDRDSNRNLAHRIEYYLEVTDTKRKPVAYAIEPIEEDVLSSLEHHHWTFTDNEIDLLAEMEHDRWLAEKKRQGYRRGDRRHDPSKRYPNLVDWEDARLTNDVKEIDREFIRRIPYVLARAGYRIIARA